MLPSQEVTHMKASKASDSFSFELSASKNRTQQKLIEHLHENFGISNPQTTLRIQKFSKSDFESALSDFFNSLTP